MNANGMYNDAALRPNLYQSGFDPRQFLRLNTNEEGRREWSLDTAFKKLWFRTIYPNGRICTTVLEKDERHICINARVYADRMDPPDSYLAEGKAERFAPGDPASAKPYATTGTRFGTPEARKPNIVNSLYLKPDQLEKTVVDRFARYEIVKANEVRVEEYLTEDADIVAVAYGATARVVRSAVEMAREEGIRAGELLSHVAILDVPRYHKLLFITDGGMVVAPTLEQKRHILKNAVDFCRRLGYDRPKAAILCAVENVTDTMPETVDAAQLKRESM